MEIGHGAGAGVVCQEAAMLGRVIRWIKGVVKPTPPPESRNILIPTSETSSKHYVELWRHFEEQGAKNKDHMITLVTWLLAFVAAIIGFVTTQYVDFDNICIKNPVALVLFPLI